jgi:hypothetical protein
MPAVSRNGGAGAESIARQQLAKSEFRSKEYTCINQSVATKLTHVSRQRTRLEESKRCPEIDTRFVATDETENNRGIVRHGDFYPVCLSVIKGSAFVNSRE